jgi:GNAT superfamily N-acetyltransferase
MWDESARAAFTELLPEGHRFPEVNAELWFALIEDPQVSLLLVEGQDGEIIGESACGSSRDEDANPSVGEVRSFFVAAGRWREGIGRRLLTAGLNVLREHGYREATVWSLDANDRANAFYEANGFTRDGAEKTEDAWAGLPEVRYRRTL